MNLEIASEKDRQVLSQFHKSFPQKGLVDLLVDRGEDYFAPYREQSDQFRTYVLRNHEGTEAGQIHGAASFVFKNILQDGELFKIAYATDLRITSNRKAIMAWSRQFLPVLQELQEKEGIRHFFSNINLTDSTLLNLFVRPRPVRRPLPRYHLYRKFNFVSLHGQFPWAPRPLPDVRIRRGGEHNAEDLLRYILKRSQYRAFSTVWDEASWQQKMKQLDGFTLNNFLIAYDSKEKIIGCLAPWRPSKYQSFIPISYSLRAHNFRQFLKFGRLLGWTHPLAKPIRSTGLESSLKFQFLTQIYVDNEDIFENLLWQAYSEARRDEFLLYAQVETDLRLMPPESWISATIPYALYAIVQPGAPAPGFLHPSIPMNPEVEPYGVL